MINFTRHDRPNAKGPSLSSRRHARWGFNPEPLEARVHLSTTVEPITGAGNNLANPKWGASGVDFVRLAKAAYADGISSPALPSDLSARVISNTVNSQTDPNNKSQDLNISDPRSLSDFGYTFGQFMDHDMDLTRDGGAALNIPVPAGDLMGPGPIPFTRSQIDPLTGTSTSNPAQQVNSSTSYFDLSQVYGSTLIVSNALRTFSNGLMKTSPGNMLPYNSTKYFTTAQLAALNMANDAQMVAYTSLFATGDRRGNETLELTALQTLFMRNHNRLAGELKTLHSDWNDQQLFDEARKLNIAQYQSIIYNEWIPAVLGSNALSKYDGYDASVNATISNEFATVAYRFGHSLLSSNAGRLNNDGSQIYTVNANGASILLAQDFFDPNLLNPKGVIDPLTNQTSSDIGAVLKGSASDTGQAMDTMVVSDVRNLLFGPLGAGGEDLIARDIQRDRDNGIPDYNTLRKAVKLPAVTDFSQITSNVQVQQALKKAYPGGVNTIDAFEGGLAEDHVAGSEVGPLFQAIMVKQFTHLRDGDRFFYLNQTFNAEELSLLNQTDTLTKVIEANTNITNLQANAFFFQVSISGRVMASSGSQGTPFRGAEGLGGMTMNLLDTSGNVVDTTTTNQNGSYQFTGLSIGTYRVREILSAGYTQMSANPADIKITRGMAVRGVYFMNYDAVQDKPTNGDGRRCRDTWLPEGSFSMSGDESAKSKIGAAGNLDNFQLHDLFSFGKNSSLSFLKF